MFVKLCRMSALHPIQYQALFMYSRYLALPLMWMAYSQSLLPPFVYLAFPLISFRRSSLACPLKWTLPFSSNYIVKDASLEIGSSAYIKSAAGLNEQCGRGC